MARFKTSDGVALYYEETGTGTPVVFVHEFAGDYRTWEPQMRYFGRTRHCVTFSARGYPPSDVPDKPEAYSQDRACEDVVELMDALGLPKAHIVGHSMGAYTALHMGIRHAERCLSVVAAGCGWGSNPGERGAARQACQDIAKLFQEQPMAVAAEQYANATMRLTYKAKDPRGFADFAGMLAEHSGPGSAMTMLNLQMERPTLSDLESELRQFAVPLLVVVGDEDGPCLDGSVFLKETVPTAALFVVPRAGHTITSEEPEAFNREVERLFQDAESGHWLTFRRYLSE